MKLLKSKPGHLPRNAVALAKDEHMALRKKNVISANTVTLLEQVFVFVISNTSQTRTAQYCKNVT